MSSSVFRSKVSVDEVKRLVDFGGKTSGYESLVELQARGTTALFNRLCSSRRFAYLADEVGMGKTYQALGVASMVWALKPDARVVFISTRVNLQEKWERDFKNFYRENYLQRAGVGRSRVEGQPSVICCRPENLRDFAVELRLPGRLGFFLRMTSFRRPVAVFENRDSWDESREKARIMMSRVGLDGQLASEAKKPGRASASGVLNEVFADALRQLLVQIGEEDRRPALDLLVIDEAQSLRNPGNQTNTVLRKIFGERDNGEARVVDRWLFLSATPVHGSRDDILHAVKVANPAYSKLDGDPTESQLKSALKEFMVRRPRTYRTNASADGSTVLTKVDYRDHRVDDEQWVVRSMSAEAALAMALVQKKLVQVLANQANRFKLGYLSSFESLHDSLRRKLGARDASDDEQEGIRSDHDNLESDGAKSDEPPDADFVQRLGDDYRNQFGRTLPHAKLDQVVQIVAERAWEHGDKLLIFTRRINTAEELAQRLEETHEDAVVARIQKVWQRDLDWKDGLSGVDDSGQEPDAAPLADGDDDAERSPGEAVDVVVRTRRQYGLRSAFREDQWLERYRNTYRSTGRNALVFHENWFRTLCRLGQVEPTEAASRVPEELWRTSYQAAAKRSGGSVRVDPVVRSHQLVIQLLNSAPSVLGLDDAAAGRWSRFLSRIYPAGETKVAAKALPATGGGREERLLLYEGFWEQWMDRGDPLLEALLAGDMDRLATRQCAMSWIGQSLRLTDALIDLRCAEAKGGEATGPYRFDWLPHFFDYLHSDHPHARALLERCRAWASHADVIIRNCFEIQGGRLELAEKGAYDELNVAAPVVRVVGGSPQPRAIRQFKMPYYPMVVVCTDVLKEGEDLHVFCDKVVHYGVAWTSGDLEQRVGRVDRFFSQIERRVRDDASAKLPVYYPHVLGSIERRQVTTVLHRVKTAERLMGDIGVKRAESRDIDVTATDGAGNGALAAPVLEHPFDVRDDDLPPSAAAPAGPGEDEHRAQASLLQSLVDWTLTRIAPDQVAPLALERPAGEGLTDLRWALNGGHVDLLWDFIPELRCYALTARQAADNTDGEVFGCYLEAVSEGHTHRARLDRLIFPREPDEGSDGKALRAFLSYVRTPTVKPTPSEERVQDVAATLRAVPGVRERTIRTDGHRVEATFDALPGRTQKVKIYVYDEMVLLSSVACRVTRALQTRFGEGPKGEAELAKWIARHNAQLRAGYVHHHRREEDGGQLCFCERVFHDLTPSETWTSLVRDVVLYADGLEVFLAGGEDVE